METKIINWLALATTNETREVFKWIISDGKRLFATDGNVLHLHHTAMNPGYYDKALRDVMYPLSIFDVPDIDNVIPRIKDRPKTIQYQSLISFEKKFMDGDTYRIYQFGDVMVNARYLDNAAFVFDDCFIHYNDAWQSLLIQDDEKTAVVMPMRDAL